MRATIVAMAAMLVLYAVWQLLDPLPGQRWLYGDVFFYPVAAMGSWTAWGAARRTRADARIGRAWLLLGAASVSYLCGDVAQTIYELHGDKPYPSAGDVFYLAFYPLVLLAMVSFPSPRRTAGERARLFVDLAVVAIGGSTVVVYVVLGPTAVAGGENFVQTVFSIAYPSGDMVLLVALAMVLLGRAPASSRTALLVFAAGLAFFVLADLIYGYQTLHANYESGDPVGSLWMVALALFAIAAAAQLPIDKREASAVGGRQQPSVLPYFAVAIAFALLVYSERKDNVFPALTLHVIAVLLAVLVSVRQYLAQKELLRAQGELTHQSLHDALTGLPNRTLVFDRAAHLLARARRTRDRIAVLYVDLDRFKEINDTFGHPAGDEMLAVVARRLASVARPGDTVGRIGGDEFVLLLEEVTTDAGPELVAERVLEVLAQPIDLRAAGERQPVITASVGIAVGDGGAAEDLLRDADVALYAAKCAGRGRYAVFESEMQTVARERLELGLDLRDALTRDEFQLVYQPIVELDSGDVTGIEALIRWRHPKKGTVAPDAFIPLAEETGMILPIGGWVLRAACVQAARWRRQDHDIDLFVNVSVVQLEQDVLLSQVREALKLSGLAPGALMLEITETGLMRDAEAVAARLCDLKELGVRIAIDDFGTGYSSLAYLAQFPVDALKIDRSFVSGIAAADGSGEALVHTLIQLGKALGLHTLGEGIEDEDQLVQLRRERCDSGQGFLFSKPLAVPDVELLLERGERALPSELAIFAR
jgi:diguanylate cyclase (GGDEF)-like protein